MNRPTTVAGAGNGKVFDRERQACLKRYGRLERLYGGAIEERSIGVTGAEQFVTGYIDGDNSHVVG